jgi:L-Lysine epsilon oxidase N-terminal/L-lysine epsilon oxidase C-terminal domain
MTTKYKIHPSIGIARLGNSDEFYIGPESLSALPIDCNQYGDTTVENGAEKTIENFRDDSGRIKRQAARFRVFMYDDKNPGGIELVVQDTKRGIKGTVIQGLQGSGELVDIQWVVWMANKKSSWWEFHELSGEHGYIDPTPVLRNADVTNRQALVIDPGPIFIKGSHGHREMAAGKNPEYTQSFPPPLAPASVDSLGTVRTDQNNHLLVVGAYGNSGSMMTGLGEPQITEYANNDGWFDDLSDGPVTAVLYYASASGGTVAVAIDDPAWCIVGYPRFAPEIPDLVTLDDLVYDLSVRNFAYNPWLYGTPPFKAPDLDVEALGTEDTKADDALAKWQRMPKVYNDSYFPYWDTEIYPILSRPFIYQTFTTVLIQDDPHETGPGGNFDLSKISVPPAKPNDPSTDKNWYIRNFVYSVLRQPGQDNVYTVTVPMPPPLSPIQQPLMPLLNGDNPLTNEIVSKFLTLTDTQLFILKQWACGKFIAGNQPTDDPSKIVGPPPASIGVQLDRGVLGNALGGAFCPGAEVTWFIRNLAIWLKPYRIHQAEWKVNIGDTLQAVPWYEDPQLNATTTENLADGLEAGDLTKRNGVPWQSDFNECTTNDTDVRYAGWNVTDDPLLSREIIWWPAHRPLQVNNAPYSAAPNLNYVQWAQGIAQTNAGDFKMVTAWKSLGFLKNTSPNPVTSPWFVQVERNDKEL